MQTLLQKMSSADSIQSLNAILMSYFYQEEISSLALTYYNNHIKTGSKLIYDWVSPALKVWHQHYLAEDYADSDRTLESSQHSLLPIYWDVYQQLAEAKNKREQRIREESIEFGIAQGLCITVYGPQGDFIVLVLHQRKNEQCLNNWQEKQFNWLFVAQCYFHFLRKHLIQNKPKKEFGLTKREQQCLELTSQGLRIEAIAKNLGISIRTIHFHLQNANKKIGVNNKYLAVLRLKGTQE